ncbi:tetratricopeptide repeat protein [Amycolatopsis sp. NPDC024027]|uniref:ATP-binding protein n=1 Tax=Amycolatopsis sp. NPDC024027 TaxID=3154327 RepID=UPI0033F5E10F
MSDDIRNLVRSDQVGTAIQAGVVHGDLHVAGAQPLRTPRQLPMAPRWHVAREREFGELTAVLEEGRPPLVVIEGAGGVGKTTLALHWAHSHTDRFPDGQLFANLRGFDPQAAPARPATVLRGFLTVLGVEPAAIPADPDAAAALFRSAVADRRMMIVLDNARDTDQVAPLLPGTPSCAVLVTTRMRLSSLRVQGAHVMRLEAMDESDASALLNRMLPTHAAKRESEAVSAIARRCGGLPLALAIASARVAAHPEFPMSVLADELDDETTRLSAFDADDESASLRAVLSWSSASLNDRLGRAFGLLGVAPLGEISVAAAACLWAVPPRDAAAMFRSLEAANLVRQHVPQRFQMHDLVRLHAAELPSGAESTRAVRRLVAFYAYTVRTADILLYPHRHAFEVPALPDGCHPLRLTDEPEAVAWFGAEHALIAVMHRIAVDRKWYEAVWHIAHGLDTYQYRLGLLAENVASSRLGLEAAMAIGSVRLRASSLRQLGRACTRAGDLDEAGRCLTQALNLEEEAGFVMGQAHTHHDLQRVLSLRGEHEQALQHAISAMELYRAESNPVGEAHALNAQGWQHAQLENFVLARECCERALELHSAHGNVSGQASTLDALGHIACRDGRLDQAVEHFAAAARQAKQLGNVFAEAECTEHLADVLARQGDAEKAHRMLRVAYDLFQSQHRIDDADRVRARLSREGSAKGLD